MLPAALVAVFAGWCGTFYGGATAAGALAAYGLLLLVAAGPGVRDPLGSGFAGRFLVLALVAAVLASWWLSPVPRAGRTALVMLPAFFFLPGALAACWPAEASRRRGLAGLAAVVAGVAVWSLADRFLLGAPRAAAPLGHHGLMAVWLVTLLPLAVLEARRPGLPRLLAVAAAVLGTAALVASGSLAGSAACAFQLAAAAFLLSRRSRGLRVAMSACLFALLALLPVLPRWQNLLAGEDASWAARRVYWLAGLEGVAARPVLGWGPGSTPWTLASFLAPRPGVNPAGELVGDLHGLPLQLAFELGLPALLLAAGLLLLWLAQPLQGARDLPLAAAARLGGAGFAVATAATGTLSATALPVALAVVVAAGRSAAPPLGRPSGDLSPRRTRWLRPPWIRTAYAILAALLVSPQLRAHHAFEAASRSEAPLVLVERAVDLDPSFPLYRARRAALTDDVEEARKAAAAAPGVAAHWLLAARLGLETGAPWTAEALRRACRLDPLSALPPWLEAERTSGSAAVEPAARALLAEPRLLAAERLRSDPELLFQAVERLQRLEGVEEGWRVRLRELAERPSPREIGFRPASAPVLLLQRYDLRPQLALSTFLFRRAPWPLALAAVELDGELAARIDLPSAAALPGTESWVFSRRSCGLGEPGGG